MRVITFKLTEDMLEALDRYAVRHGMTRSEVIRLALIKLIESNTYSRNEIKVRRLVIS